MDILKERVLKEGKVLGDNILKVSNFLNHMVDPHLMHEIGKEFARIFAPVNPTKVLTVESSGIAMSVFAALELNVPCLVAKKYTSHNVSEDFYSVDIFSHTKQTTYNVRVACDYLQADDRVLIIDDFLANGKAVLGTIELLKESGASLVGIGICVEKSFQAGAAELEGLNLHSLVRVKSLENGVITLCTE